MAAFRAGRAPLPPSPSSLTGLSPPSKIAKGDDLPERMEVVADVQEPPPSLDAPVAPSPSVGELVAAGDTLRPSVTEASGGVDEGLSAQVGALLSAVTALGERLSSLKGAILRPPAAKADNSRRPSTAARGALAVPTSTAVVNKKKEKKKKRDGGKVASVPPSLVSAAPARRKKPAATLSALTDGIWAQVVRRKCKRLAASQKAASPSPPATSSYQRESRGTEGRFGTFEEEGEGQTPLSPQNGSYHADHS